VGRQRWSSGLTFVLAAIGAAIGIGNVWRFPYICYTNGGGAFLIPYTVALLTAGIPLLLLEFGLGYKTRAGAPRAFSRLLGSRYSWIGWLSVITGFAIVTYYCVIMAWAADYALFSVNLAWGSDPEGFFFDSFLHRGPINLLVVGGAAISWLWVYLAVRKGVVSVEKMIWITVLLPWVLIMLFVIRGMTLPGASDGIAYYLTPDFSALLKPGVWLAAYGQIFFTLSLGWGVMVAYASLLPEKIDIVRNSLIIAGANALTSFISGFAVFSTIGYLAYEAGVPVSEVVKGGIELAFVTYPAAISLLPFAPEVFGILFFLMLVTLGVDSAFATVEAAAVSITDWFPSPRWLVSGLLCCLGFAIGLVFATDAGYYWLDIADYYLSTFMLVTVGLFEAVAIGYLYGPERLRKFIGVGWWWDICIRFVVPASLLAVLATSLIERLGLPYGSYPVFMNAVGWGIVIGIPVLSVMLMLAVLRHCGEDRDD